MVGTVEHIGVQILDYWHTGRLVVRISQQLSAVGMNGYNKLILWLDNRYNSVALVQSELESCISCPIIILVYNNRSSLVCGANPIVNIITIFPSINSAEEQRNLGDHIQSFGMGHEHFWTSGTDQAEEGKFFWMSTGKPVTYESWNAGEPNNFQ